MEMTAHTTAASHALHALAATPRLGVAVPAGAFYTAHSVPFQAVTAVAPTVFLPAVGASHVSVSRNGSAAVSKTARRGPIPRTDANQFGAVAGSSRLRADAIQSPAGGPDFDTRSPGAVGANRPNAGGQL
jgi:hypothetical protein